jgi:ankyrin repeat protein
VQRAVEHDDVGLLASRTDVKAVNRYGAAPTSVACARGNAQVVEVLLDAGADVNTALPEGETCLMSAANTGSLRTVKALLVRGANVNAAEAWKGQTALMCAARSCTRSHGSESRARPVASSGRPPGS